MNKIIYISDPKIFLDLILKAALSKLNLMCLMGINWIKVFVLPQFLHKK